MRVYPLKTEDGAIFGFEIDNVYIGLSKVARVLSSVGGVSNLKRRKPFDSRSECHIEFDYNGARFVVWEPFGDSSRYWIGPKDKDEIPEKVLKRGVSDLSRAFEEYRPPVAVRILGDLLSLNFRR